MQFRKRNCLLLSIITFHHTDQIKYTNQASKKHHRLYIEIEPRRPDIDNFVNKNAKYFQNASNYKYPKCNL